MLCWALSKEAIFRRAFRPGNAWGDFRTATAFALCVTWLLQTGCAEHRNDGVQSDPTGWAAPAVIVVAPVINLSDNADWDPVKATDIVAAAFTARPKTAVVPVNLVMASLARRGRSGVSSAAEAVELAQEFGADATVVTAVTAWRPYDPPLVGLIMQWYAAQPLRPGEGPDAEDTVLASSNEHPANSAGSSLPRYQVQRVFDAADHGTRAEIKRFAAHRPGLDGPYGWQVVCKSQELFMRYCSWACIRSITRAVDLAAATAGESAAESTADPQVAPGE